MGKLYDRVKVATTTVGTGTITLGAAERSATFGDFLSFAEAGVPDGALVSYWILEGNLWAKGEGVYTASGATLARDANEVSWNGSAQASAKLALAGAAKVFITPRAADIMPYRSITVSTANPTGGADGDIWFKVD
jgi:hypothetical protein